MLGSRKANDAPMVRLDPAGSRSEHEAAIAQYLTELDPQLGPLLLPYLKFDRLNRLSDSDRRRLRSEVASVVRRTLDNEDATG